MICSHFASKIYWKKQIILQKLSRKNTAKWNTFFYFKCSINVHLVLLPNLSAFREGVKDWLKIERSPNAQCEFFLFSYNCLWCMHKIEVIFSKKKVIQSKFCGVFWREDYVILQKRSRGWIVQCWKRLAKTHKCFLEKRLSLVE